MEDTLMCKIALSVRNYESKELYLNTLILNQRGRPFTKQEIVSFAEQEGIDASLVHTALQRLILKRLIVCSGNKFYVRPIIKKNIVKNIQY